ncbi:MAG: hypothetical protein WCP85_16075 [Mariniphaga sp.]
MNFFFYYIRQFYKQWFLTFVVIIGLASGILQISPLPNNSYIANIAILILCLIISITSTLIIYRIKHISDDEIWMLEKPRDKPLIVFPYQKVYLKAANSLARIHYGKSSPNYNTVKKWYKKNPFILSILTDSHNKFVGYFDILPLEFYFGKDFISGTVKENDIGYYNILPPEQMHSTEYIYFAGISVKDQDTQLGRKHGAILVYAALVYLETFYDLSKPKKIYAIPVSDCGKHLIEKLDFQIETDQLNRKDKLDLYSRTFTFKEICAYKRQFSFCKNKFDYSSYSKALQQSAVRIE